MMSVRSSMCPISNGRVDRKEVAGAADLVKIRSYCPEDKAACHQMFSSGMQLLINSVVQVVFPEYYNHAAILGVLAIFVGMKWSYWYLAGYILACVMFFAMVYIVVYLGVWKFINHCLTSDLLNIEKSYMASEGSHMFIAEWKGEVVGMVGMLERKTDKNHFVELQRMSVSLKYHRMGIAKKLVERAVQFARAQRYNKIVLSTTTAQFPAIKLYTRCSFKHSNTISQYPRILKGMKVWQFELQLE